MLVWVVAMTNHNICGVYTKKRKAVARREELARHGYNTTITSVVLNKEHDSGTQDEGGEV